MYFANGREIGSVDSQPTKFAARELLLRGSLALNHVVGATPELLSRHTIVLAADGRYRSTYSPVPALTAAAVNWPLASSGVLDLKGPQAAGRIAKFAASLLTAIAVAIAFLTMRRSLPMRPALLLAAGLGLGTGLWSTVSQTLWQHETAILGFMVAVHALTARSPGTARGLLIGAGIALACTSRLSVLPAGSVLLLATWACYGTRTMIAALSIVAAAGAILIVHNINAFGHVLGPLPYLESLHGQFHATDRSFQLGWEGYAGLLISPSRGLLIFSPVVAVAVLGIRAAWSEGWRAAQRWCLLAAAAQFALYGAYSVWWAGHTFGPRYMLDVLPFLVPSAALGMTHLRLRSVGGACAALALAWSIAVSALGAYVYPAELWNTDPREVDQYHERLWDWRDTQIRRAYETPPNPRNFMLFE
ncbi:MAG: hypothetical protein M3468_07875 [Acidobacteriota bacterium]|nr:hypothetical protein [Acidobacteriota bacterium]